MKLHVAAVDGYALRWLISRFLPVEPRAFEPLTKANATKEARDGGQCRSLVRASARAVLLHKATSSVRLLGLSLRFLPANRRKKEVDPTRLELVASAMRGRSKGFAAVHYRSKDRLNKPNPRIVSPRMFAIVRAGCRQLHKQILGIRGNLIHGSASLFDTRTCCAGGLRARGSAKDVGRATDWFYAGSCKRTSEN